MGYQAFATAAAAACVDGVLTVDIPPEESHDLIEALPASLAERAVGVPAERFNNPLSSTDLRRDDRQAN